MSLLKIKVEQSGWICWSVQTNHNFDLQEIENEVLCFSFGEHLLTFSTVPLINLKNTMI